MTSGSFFFFFLVKCLGEENKYLILREKIKEMKMRIRKDRCEVCIENLIEVRGTNITQQHKYNKIMSL